MNKNNHISLLITSLTLGGAQSVCVDLANNFIRRGWTVDLIVLHLNDAIYLERLNSEVNLINLNVIKARHAISALGQQLANVQTLLVFNYELTLISILMKYIRHRKISVIAITPSIISENSKNIRGTWKRWVLSNIINLFYGKSDFVVCQSQGVREDFIRIFPEASNRVTVIPNPISSPIEQFSNQLTGQETRQKDYLLCVGRLEPEKGFDDAIRAFAAIHTQFPQLRLKFLGTGSLKPELTTLAIKLKVEKLIDFEGFQSNLIPYYLNASATLLTSHYEGLGNVLVESIALGTPIVAFDCPSGPRDIVVEGSNGYLIPFRDQSKLEEGIIKCLMTAWDHQAVHQTALKFSSKHIIDAYVDIIKQNHAQ
jgi:glycosyltransferase involved in cell wall biosynthesis